MLKQVRTAVALTVGALGLLTNVAHAGTIASGLGLATGGDLFDCSVVNVGTTPITSVTVDLVSFFGAVTNTTTCSSVFPGSSCDVATAANPGYRWCRVTFTGKKNKFRALMNVYDSSFSQMKQNVPVN